MAMKRRFDITGADIDGLPGITRPDYPISFIGEVGEVSADSVAQFRGGKLWRQMHGETPRHIYYTETPAGEEETT